MGKERCALLQTARDVVQASYGELACVPAAMGAHFTELLASEGAPDPQRVVDAYLNLADMPQGQRPTRTVGGITRGADEINRLTLPIQDAILKEMQLDGVLSGLDA